MWRMQLPEQLNSLQKSNHLEQDLCANSNEPKVTFLKEPRYYLSKTKDIFLKEKKARSIDLFFDLQWSQRKKKQSYTPFTHICIKH